MIHVINTAVSFMVASLALWQSYDCPSAGEVILKNMGWIDRYLTKTNPNIAWTVHNFREILNVYCGISFADASHIFFQFCNVMLQQLNKRFAAFFTWIICVIHILEVNIIISKAWFLQDCKMYFLHIACY